MRLFKIIRRSFKHDLRIHVDKVKKTLWNQLNTLKSRTNHTLKIIQRSFNISAAFTWTRTLWVFKVSFLLNLCPQISHSNGSSPVWMIMWRFNLYFEEYDLWQMGHSGLVGSCKENNAENQELNVKLSFHK